MLNWLTRYAFVRDALHFDESGGLLESVLDVGCGPHGLSIVAPLASFAGVDVEFPAPVAAGMTAFRNVPGPLPFADAAFDTVVCLDVLEHVPPADRASFVADLARVAARRVLIACPSDEGGWIDAHLRSAYAARGIRAPSWLNEHDEFGLPTAAEIAAHCAAPAGFTATELVMTNGLLSTLAVIADMLPEYADRARTEFALERENWIKLFSAARFGACYRKAYVLERVEPRVAIADPANLPETALAAARCATFTRDGDRVWDLRPAVPVAPVGPDPLPEAAPELAPEYRAARPGPAVRLLLRPAWRRPETWLPALATYVEHTDDSSPTELVIDAGADDTPAAVSAEMLVLACEALSPSSAANLT